MGSTESRKFTFNIKPEALNEKGTDDNEAIYQYIEKARNATCQIILKNGYGFGFFCRIPYSKNDNLLLNVLLTCEHVLKEEIIFSENEIKIKIGDTVENISLKGRKKWSNKEMDYSCIEILEKDKINDFYCLDDIIFKKNYKNEIYIDKKMNHIYVFALMKKRRGHSSGLIKKINNYNFIHDCNTYKGSSGGVIVNKNNNCVIGMHKGELETKVKNIKDKVINIGIFIKDIIENIKLSPKGNNSSKEKLTRKKITFIGDSATGAKTNLIWALVKEEPSINFVKENGTDMHFTVGFDMNYKKINISNRKILMFFWDLQGVHISLINNMQFIKNSNIICLGYDITDKKSFKNIKDFWIPMIKREINENIKFYLIGNKVDLEESREVPRKEAEEYAKENNYLFFEVSAYYYINIKELLSDLIESCLNQDKKV